MHSPIRPALRPGAAILRRDPRRLQIGMNPGVIIADRPGLWAYLLLLDGTRNHHEIAARVPALVDPDLVLTELLSAGAVVDAASWDTRQLDEARAHACSAHTPALAARQAARLTLHADPGAQSVEHATRYVLRSAGVRHLDEIEPDLVVHIFSGEPARSRIDEQVTQAVDHLVVRLVERQALIGPLMMTGIGPCVRCHDLARADLDHSWAALVPQFGHRAAHHNLPALAALTIQAAAVAIADSIMHYLDSGRRGGGSLVTVGPHHLQRVQQRLNPHPACSCSLLPMSRSA